MTPAEFDTRRRSLGLSTRETADLCGVQERTVNRWQAGAITVPVDAAAVLDDLDARMGEAVEQMVDAASDMTDTGPVVLLRYRTEAAQRASPHAGSLPAGAHAMLIAWTADELGAEGIETRIEWAD